MYNVPYPRRGRVIKSVAEEYQFTIILRLFGGISSGEGTEISGKKNQDLKRMGVGKNIKL